MADEAPGTGAAVGVPVSVWGMVRGREIAGRGHVALADDGVAIEIADADGARPAVALAWSALDGAHGDDRLATLFPSNGDVVELTPIDGESAAGASAPGEATSLGAFARRLVGVVCIVPELTVALRGLGAARARPGPDHDRFFAPLLASRTAAARATEPLARLAAVDAAALDAGITRTMRTLAAERFPKRPPERRALEAELLDLAEPVVDRIAVLAAAERAVRDARPDELFVRWRAWAAAYRAVFMAADVCWLAAAPVLADTDARARR
jgi:hypothetical protein